MLFQSIDNKPQQTYCFFQEQDLCSRETFTRVNVLCAFTRVNVLCAFTRVNVLCAFTKPQILSPHLQNFLPIYSYFALLNPYPTNVENRVSS